MKDQLRDPVPMSMGDAGKFIELDKEVHRLIAEGRQDTSAVVRSFPGRLTIRLIFEGEEFGDAQTLSPTPEELRAADVYQMAADFVAAYRDEQRRRRK